MLHIEEKLRRLELKFFVGATLCVALVNFPQLRIPSTWLDTIPQALQLRAGFFFSRRAFLFAFFLPGSLVAFFMRLPSSTGEALSRV